MRQRRRDRPTVRLDQIDAFWLSDEKEKLIPNHCEITLSIQTHLELSGLSCNRCEAAVTDFSSIKAEDGKKQQPSRWNCERLAFFFWLVPLQFPQRLDGRKKIHCELYNVVVFFPRGTSHLLVCDAQRRCHAHKTREYRHVIIPTGI
jgi:hypothetical protein